MKNAQTLYEPFGFTEGAGPLVYMERRIQVKGVELKFYAVGRSA